jgi:sarcosine oxidase subunit alpha
LFRVSFTGELGFEINVPSGYGLSVWEAIWERGRDLDMVSYGTETMHVLRAEKGFVIVGQETDATVTLDDLGLSRMISKTKSDFVGKRSLMRPDLIGPGRKQLVGLLTENAEEILEEGAQIVADPLASTPIPTIGHVTSSYRSANVGRSIALALVKDGRTRLGHRVYATTPSGFTRTLVGEPIFFDREGTRINA